MALGLIHSIPVIYVRFLGPTEICAVICVVLCIVCVSMRTVLLPPADNPIAVKKYIARGPTNLKLLELSGPLQACYRDCICFTS
jgi:hypothetical protein